MNEKWKRKVFEINSKLITNAATKKWNDVYSNDEIFLKEVV